MFSHDLKSHVWKYLQSLINQVETTKVENSLIFLYGCFLGLIFYKFGLEMGNLVILSSQILNSTDKGVVSVGGVEVWTILAGSQGILPHTIYLFICLWLYLRVPVLYVGAMDSCLLLIVLCIWISHGCLQPLYCIKKTINLCVESDLQGITENDKGFFKFVM